MQSALIAKLVKPALLLVFATTALAQQASKPLTLEEIEGLLKGGVTNARVQKLAEDKGVVFEVTDNARARLQRAGASAGLIVTIERVSRALQPTEPRTQPDAIRSPSRTALIVRTNVAHDEVEIDGHPVGSSGPTVHDVQPGKHRIIVKCQGYNSAELDVGVREGETKTVRLELVAIEPTTAAPTATIPPPTVTATPSLKSTPVLPVALGRRVVVATSLGSFTIEVYPDRAPKTVENFLTYVRDLHYDGTIFHRVIPGFMIQGGGFDAAMKQSPTRAPIANEADNGLKNEIGTVSMARTSDPNSATAQFFVNVNDNAFLDYRDKTKQGWGYAVFGRVIEGMEVVHKIERVTTTTRSPHQNVPVTPVVIESIRIAPAR